jgi:hypothetical protein
MQLRPSLASPPACSQGEQVRNLENWQCERDFEGFLETL